MENEIVENLELKKAQERLAESPLGLWLSQLDIKNVTKDSPVEIILCP